ncbi:thiaminase II [Jeotgalibacillus proteolyticus]|uniref:Aminopyrimidine aminohydrolase n=1 Tax=Jeotgalibacillus proteolyticus TaxID=2082395 RepID=A0A2S5G8J4_9BACL|nr:thiaminase II [Jeotgalibacillus proteolyticus]PPA69253.1 thiaminase II [Jeotgalibacillus proteolyticus]
MTFTEELRKENEDIFSLIFEHQFVQGIGRGDVSKEALTHYVKADYEYLNAFMKVYGIAISKCASREDIAYFNQRIDFVLNSEIHPHNNFCEQIGVSYEELQGFSLPPTADHYIKHMLYHAQSGTLGEILAALLPCPWTYFEIGEELIKQYDPSPEHPFYQWISFYAERRVEDTVVVMCERLDKLAEVASQEEKTKMKEAFRKSCQLEWAFWEMAFTCEEWITKKGVSVNEKP